jgi:hypothetical protein
MHSSSRAIRVWSAVAFVAALLCLIAASAQASSGSATKVTRIGKVNLRHLAATAKPKQQATAGPGTAVYDFWLARQFREADEGEDAGPDALAAPLPTPDVAGMPVFSNEALDGFQGLTSRDQAFASGVVLEPPDQGLCGGTFQGTTYLFESVNLAIALYDTDTNAYSPAIDIAPFFGQKTAFNPDKNKFGPFLSDPKCYFDPDTGHWFHSILEIDQDPRTGALEDSSHTLLAVSATRDPAGDYFLYSLRSTHVNHPHCPCFGDQPLIGADANGFYVTTSEYSFEPFGGFTNGSQIYALDKRALEEGTGGSAVVFNTGTTRTASVQPATSPNGHYETARGGTEYFMSAFDCLPPDCHFNSSLGNKITVWALTNTQSLRTNSPNVTLTSKNLTSEVFGAPVPQTQKPGPRPLGRALGEPLPVVQANDARMNQVVYAAGRLWSGANTKLDPGPRTGIAWFSVDPSVSASGVDGTIADQGYVAAPNGNNVSFPSIGVNDQGRGVVAYTLMGPDYYPSSAYTPIDTSGLGNRVQVSRQGFRPEDGFSCYPEFYPPGTPPQPCRWGDYSASFALPDGTVWSAAEMIGDTARLQFSNWSTFVWPVAR